jgi:hypothetical protein
MAGVLYAILQKLRRWIMLTNLAKDELIALGARHRADYLVEQAGYTLGIAAKEGDAMKDLLPEGFIEGAQGVLAKVSAARQDKALLAEESKEATKKQNVAAGEAKVWRRRVAKRALRAMRLGESVPDGLIHLGRVKSPPELAGQVDVMVKFLEENLAKMPGKGGEDLVKEGKDLSKALKVSDAEQEVKRFTSLPGSVKNFYAQKGTLYIALKAINDAGHELHARDSDVAGRFNLSILYRRGVRRNAQGEILAPKPKKE